MKLQELDNKYHFTKSAIAIDSALAYKTVDKFFNGCHESMTIRNANKVIRSLPITREERDGLILSLFNVEADEDGCAAVHV